MRQAWHKIDLLQKKYQRQILFCFCGVVLGSNLLLAGRVLFHDDKVIMVPPSFSKEMWVQGSAASPSYIIQMALYVSHLLLDVSPHHMAFQHDTLLKYVSSSSLSVLQTKLKQDVAYYQSQGMSSMFHPSHLHHDPLKKEVILKGTLTQMESSKVIDTKPKTYLLTYTLNDGFFQVVSFQEGDGDSLKDNIPLKTKEGT